MHNFKELMIWKRSIEHSVFIYKITAEFPESEKFGLISQLRRCSVSIPSNIAEGAGRGSDKDFIRFLSIAKGSAFELESQLIIANKLNYITEEDFQIIQDKTHEIQNMIHGFMTKLNASKKIVS